jgi:ATP-dependent DNA helicase RecG
MYHDKIALTMQSILEKEFKVDARGYRMQEVDQFLDIIIRDYNEYNNIINNLINEKKALALENNELKQEVRDLRSTMNSLKNSEKEEVMQKFKNKEYDILVCTTVVEVGVDVPNATVIVIENAERFGLSQLHQLRGRVGRNSLQSYCVLVSSTKNEETIHRLNVLVQTNDGFVIAEKDLEIRGPGEFLGIRQSGILELRLADLTKDLDILELARKDAKEFISSSNDYSKALKQYLNSSLSALSQMDISD